MSRDYIDDGPIDQAWSLRSIADSLETLVAWQATPPLKPDSLDTALAEAVAALPEGGYIWTEGPYGGHTDSDGNVTILGYSVHAFRTTEEPYRHAIELAKAVAPTLTAALRALTAKLRGKE